MKYQYENIRNPRRRGMILLIVMAMLSLFASVALGFVFYADAEAVASNMNLQAQQRDQPDVDTEALATYFLSQLLYPTDNIYSALRGHDLARSMYGYNPGVLNFIPYNGVGRSALSYPVAFGSGPRDNYQLPNYTRYEGAQGADFDPYLNFLRNPEFYGKTGDANFRYVGGANPPWTSFDTNSLFLANVGADGTVYLPSFYRSWMPGSGTSAASKYMLMSPDAAWHPAMTLPDMDGGGHVKNLEFGLGVPNNDSIWMDLGYPILTSPSGKRFKPLFAPLIVDLSNRLHLWAHGNRLGTNGAHVSNRGYGATEVNLSKVLTNNPELQALFNLKYGGLGGAAGALPAGSPITFPNSANLSWFAKIDADAFNPGTGRSSDPFVTAWAIRVGMNLAIDVGTPNAETVTVTSVTPATNSFTAVFANPHANGATVRGIMPGGFAFATNSTAAIGSGAGSMSVNAVAYNSYFPFPSYPAGWDNAFTGAGPTNEITQKPLGLNLLNPIAPNLAPLPASHMEALLRWGGTNSPALQSEIFRRMPTTFANIRARNMVTTTNWCLDRIHATPMINWDPTTAGHYQLTPSGYPTWTAAGGPQAPVYGTVSTYPANSEYTGDWRSKLGDSLRLNLNRQLPDYPAPNVVGVIVPGNYPAYNAAIGARKQFARDIYNALVRVTGAQDPNTLPPASVVPASGDYQAARWLAQLAVNIVDYVDNDDFVTPFNWYGGEWVFGTELPRAVLNEVYAQNDNVTTDPGVMTGTAATMNKLNVWVELHNPFMTTPGSDNYPNYLGAARFRLGANAAYQVVVCPTSPGLTAALRNPGNNYGDPEFNNGGVARTLSTSANWPVGGKGKGKTAYNRVFPNNGAASDPTQTNVGFFVLGPAMSTYVPGRNPSLPTTHTTPEMSITTDPVALVPSVTLLLRRLAVPQLPPNPDPTSAQYNPYITVDYFENVPVNDNRTFNATGAQVPAGMGTFQSYGRSQPYAAERTTQVAAQVGVIPGSNPQTSFFRQNSNAPGPFTWLTHLDRPLVNQLELLHVSGFKPHELTQQFITPAGPFGHYAPWNVPAAGIYRALEVLGVPDNMLGTTRGGRVPGRVNINTMTEPEIFHAICDAQDAIAPYASFTTSDVQTAFAAIIAARSAGGPEGTPFKSFAAGSMALGTFLPGNAHPYARLALAQKAYNNVTTTSNTFAVWWTVGFFEVVDETVRPARLGPEIGRDENKHIRHRFFAIVDRSGMQLFNTNSTNNININAALPLPQTNTMNFTPLTGNAGAVPLAVQPGMLLEIDSGPNAEVVVVRTVAGNSFTADFMFPHPLGASIVCRGNPGPQLNYNPRRDSNVVLHLGVIQ
ncbi:MAG: hypothetical protein HYX68_02860 [Planctomycetes bacterium]|nr:hypothetical protein [Planctomycetota bacterium]